MIKWCKLCVLPNSRPNLKFNKNGICSACINHLEKKKINWHNRRKIFLKFVKNAKAKSHTYDCLIPVSGGKDSTWQVLKAQEYGLKVLTFTWKTPFRTKIGEKNLKNLINLGVDHIEWTINPEVERIVMKETFKTKGSTAISMHTAIFNLPIQIATKFKIPLILWGENSSYEYGDDKNLDKNFILNKRWVHKYGVTNNANIKRILSKESKKNFSNSYEIYTSKKKSIIKSIFLGHFFEWDPDKIMKQVAKKGFKKGKKPEVGFYKYADIDDNCIMPIHHWLKYYKFGFTREFDNLSLEIRNLRISRKKAIEILRKTKFNPPLQAIRKFCKYYNFREKEFFSICKKFINKKIWKINSYGKLLHRKNLF